MTREELIAALRERGAADNGSASQANHQQNIEKAREIKREALKRHESQ